VRTGGSASGRPGREESWIEVGGWAGADERDGEECAGGRRRRGRNGISWWLSMPHVSERVVFSVFF
jgi:hypothetical protein